MFTVPFELRAPLAYDGKLLGAVGEYTLCSARRELRFRGCVVDLQPRVFDVLSYLVLHRDRVVG